MYRHFLVPVDDSDAGIDTVAQAVALARSVGARITFAYRADSLALAQQDGAHAVECAATGRPAAGRRFDDCVREMVIVKAEAAARALGVPCESMRMASPAAQLASTASARGCDLVCVASQATAASDVPVLHCVVRRAPAAVRVVAALYRLHRATAAALCERLAHSGLAHIGLARPDMDPRGLDALRIPRLGSGDACRLSSLLSGRTSVVDAELGELERQHQRGAALFAELERAVAAGAANVEDALSGYAQFVWEYFGRKEGVIVPAAQRYLREDDWRDLEAAFGLGGIEVTSGTP
ncbi:universal stress protein [Paraburkholderia sacchari]|uniref:universal stress protein n=1 Tax=Paraburkholderia sacchari TaxID=159450 RepID=UPI00054454C0|nr:universal stress protein [Paraburkholderia sacchari]NLP65450.1 universal stress protein [Paraburkholderia sacchari]